jgi:antitoxin (DNA-binding transcriptional repressor) of toxin-antitoxin stability system
LFFVLSLGRIGCKEDRARARPLVQSDRPRRQLLAEANRASPLCSFWSPHRSLCPPHRSYWPSHCSCQRCLRPEHRARPIKDDQDNDLNAHTWPSHRWYWPSHRWSDHIARTGRPVARLGHRIARPGRPVAHLSCSQKRRCRQAKTHPRCQSTSNLASPSVKISSGIETFPDRSSPGTVEC